MPRDVPDHLLVVVRGEEGLVLAAVGHRDPADEVGQPDVRCALLPRILVEIVVDLPRLVADHEVVVAFAHDVVEHHEVVDQDLVHAANRLEAVQVVLGGLALDVLRLAREVAARRMNRLALAVEDTRHGMLREPIDLEAVDACLAARARSRRRAARGRGRSATRRRAPAWPRRPGRGGRGAGSRSKPGSRNSRNAWFTCTGFRAIGPWPEPSTASRRVPARGQSFALRERSDLVAGSVDHERRALDAGAELARRARRRSADRGRSPPAWSRRSRGPSRQRPRSASSSAARRRSRRTNEERSIVSGSRCQASRLNVS